MRKFIIPLLIVLSIVSINITVNASDADATLKQAEVLKELGLFKGSEQGFELERQPLRSESAVMLVRLLGKESEALNSDSSHPFVDVPDWASPYVTYLYQNGLTNGVSDTEFGSSLPVDSKSYLTFLLRTLEYDDSNNDFSWNSVNSFANEKYMISQIEILSLTAGTFSRGDMVNLSSRAFFCTTKESGILLYEKLIADGAISAYKKSIITGNLRNNNNMFYSVVDPLTGESTNGSARFGSSDVLIVDRLNNGETLHELVDDGLLYINYDTSDLVSINKTVFDPYRTFRSINATLPGDEPDTTQFRYPTITNYNSTLYEYPNAQGIEFKYIDGAYVPTILETTQTNALTEKNIEYRTLVNSHPEWIKGEFSTPIENSHDISLFLGTDANTLYNAFNIDSSLDDDKKSVALANQEGIYTTIENGVITELSLRPFIQPTDATFFGATTSMDIVSISNILSELPTSHYIGNYLIRHATFEKDGIHIYLRDGNCDGFFDEILIY